MDKKSFPSSKGRIHLIASYSRVFSEPLLQSSCQTALVQGVDEGEFDFIATMFGTNVDQRSPRMVSIIVKGTLFLYHLLVWKSCTLSRTRCQCLKWKLTRRIHNLLEFVFDLRWPIMTGPRRISHRTSTPRYEMVSLAMLYNLPDYF